MEASGSPFGELDDAVHGFDGALRQAGIEVGHDAVAMFFDGGDQFDEGWQAAPLRPSAPPGQQPRFFRAVGVDVLQGATQREGSTQESIGLG